MPAAAWAARSGRRGSLQRPQPGAGRHAGGAAAPRGLGRLRPRAGVGDLEGGRHAGSAGCPRACSGSAPPASSRTPSSSPATPMGHSGGTSTIPGTEWSSPTPTGPLDAAAAASLASSGKWGPLLVTDTADALPPELRAFLLDIKPGYATDPTRAVYNHIWLMGDATAIGGQVQAEVDELAELAPIGDAAGPGNRHRRGRSARRRRERAEPDAAEGEEVSEAERPDRLTRPVTVEDIRALAGPSTPHFALQIRNRIERLIERLPEDDPVRREGEVQIARLNELARAQRGPARRNGGGALMKELADGVWHIKCLPGLPWAVNAYLAGDALIDAGCRQSTGRILKQLDGHEVTAHALTHAHPDHQGASRDVCEKLGIPFLLPGARCTRGRGPQADRRAPAGHVHGPLLLADLPRPGPQGRQGDRRGRRGRRLQGDRRARAHAPDMWSSGGSPTGS